MEPKNRNKEAIEILKALGFGPKQSNELAGYVLLALLDLHPSKSWKECDNPLMGITPIMEYIHRHYGIKYAPNTRETVRDEAVKHLVEVGILLRNSDNLNRPTNSGKTVYQIERNALSLFRSYGSDLWEKKLKHYLKKRAEILNEINRKREMARIPVILPNNQTITISPGGQNPLIKKIIEDFCPRFTPGAFILYIGDTENKFRYFESQYLLEKLGVFLEPSVKIPDVIVHDPKRNWLLLIEAVTSAGSIDGKRRKELKQLFKKSKAGLVFVTAFVSRATFGKFQSQISWETEVWISDEPDHIIHFNGDRFLGPYPDVLPGQIK
ncbi:MAG: BsuBI/PstI family type II restriction endonuclease [Candidatus Omnitrophota bacterium]